MGVAAAQERRVQHPVRGDVIDIAAGTREKAAILDARNPCSDPAFGGGVHALLRMRVRAISRCEFMSVKPVRR